MIDGESLPRRAGPGDAVFAGTINLGAALRISVTAAGDVYGVTLDGRAIRTPARQNLTLPTRPLAVAVPRDVTTAAP